MIFLKLFLTFLEIGALSFGGGSGMISLLREKALTNGWLNEEEFLNMIAIAESTPGPIAVNMATYVGSTQGGLLGSLLATLGVILPSFIIILIIASLIRNFLKYRPVIAFLDGVRPVVAGAIMVTVITMMLSVFFGITTVKSTPVVDLPAILIFLILFAVSFFWKKYKQKKPSPILLILLSAGLGMAIYPFT